MLSEIDAAGVMATPANSSYNELVIEAGRESILNGGKMVRGGVGLGLYFEVCVDGP